MWSSHHRTLLAEAYILDGCPDLALLAVDEAIARVDQNSEHQFKSLALCTKGDALLASACHDGKEAERCYREAIDIARSQSAKAWELRAANRLARLWHSQGKAAEACDLLASVYGWFTEGFDTADLKEAKALLDELT